MECVDSILTRGFSLISGASLPWPDYQHQFYYEPRSAPRRRSTQHRAGVSSKSARDADVCVDKQPGCFKCPKCGKGYRWLRNMKNHLKVECGKDPMECCPYCPHRTKYKRSLQKHILRIHCAWFDFDSPRAFSRYRQWQIPLVNFVVHSEENASLLSH